MMHDVHHFQDIQNQHVDRTFANKCPGAFSVKTKGLVASKSSSDTLYCCGCTPCGGRRSIQVAQEKCQAVPFLVIQYSMMWQWRDSSFGKGGQVCRKDMWKVMEHWNENWICGDRISVKADQTRAGSKLHVPVVLGKSVPKFPQRSNAHGN